MDITSFAIVGAVAALWGQIRSFLERFRALFVVRVLLVGEVALATHSYIYRHGRVLRWGDRNVRSFSTWVRPLDRVAEVAAEGLPPHPLFAILNGRLLMFEGDMGNGQNSHSVPSGEILKISALRGSLDIEALTRAALADALLRQTTGKRYFVRRVGGKLRERELGKAQGVNTAQSPSSYPGETIRPGMRFLHWNDGDIGAPQPKDAFAAMAMDPEGESARLDFRRWLSLKQWYQDRGIPWRRGFLFHGPPGTGKTSLARALAQEADMPVFAFDLSTLDNEQMCYEWQNMQEHSPCMALIEDIDGVFHGRENVLGERGAGLTFDCLLNCLGGIQSADGVFVIVTTNRPETLDEALGRPDEAGGSTRPGRIDRSFCLPMPSSAQRLAILQRIIGASTPMDLRATEGLSVAQVTEYAIGRALDQTWRDQRDAA